MKQLLRSLAALLLVLPTLAATASSAVLPASPSPALAQVSDPAERAALTKLEEAKAALDAAREELGDGSDAEKQAAFDAAETEYDASLDAARELRDRGDGKGGELGLAIFGVTSEGADGSLNLVAKWTEQATDWLVDEGPGWGLRILFFLLIIAAFKFLAGLGGKLTGKALQTSRLSVSDLLKKFFVGTVRKVIFFVGLIIALGQLGIDTGPLLAGIGVVGFVVGFALQDTLGNFASGIMILLYRPYDVGDVITAAGETGKVEDMSLVSSTMLTPDNQKLIIPNSAIWGGTIRNITAQDTRRVDLVIGVGYGDDLDKAQKVLLEVANAHEKVMKDPEVVVKVTNLGDSSVDFVVRPWCKTSDYWDVYWDLTKTIKQRLDEEGISIPFPQRDLHLVEVPEKLALSN